MGELAIRVNPPITSTQLYGFYQRNGICEAGYAEERAAVVLAHPSLIVAAFDGERLVAIARALTDGLAAVIMELSVEVELQGVTRLGNGSVIEADAAGIGRRIGRALLDELAARRIDFVSLDVVEEFETGFYESLGFQRSVGMTVYAIDRRPYVTSA